MINRIFFTRINFAPIPCFSFPIAEKSSWIIFLSLVFLEDHFIVGFFFCFLFSFSQGHLNYNWIARGINESFWAVVQRYQKWKQSNLILKYLDNFLDSNFKNHVCLFSFEDNHLHIHMHNLAVFLKVVQTVYVIHCLSFFSSSFS